MEKMRRGVSWKYSPYNSFFSCILYDWEKNRELYGKSARRQEEHSIMNFAVCFLKMLALYMLWRAQFLSELYVVF